MLPGSLLARNWLWAAQSNIAKITLPIIPDIDPSIYLAASQMKLRFRRNLSKYKQERWNEKENDDRGYPNTHLLNLLRWNDAHVENFLPQKCNILAVLNITVFKYNRGKTNNKFIIS